MVNCNDNAGGENPGEGNGVIDINDETPLAHPDPDLKPVTLMLLPSDLEYGKVTLDVPGNLMVWDDSEKNEPSGKVDDSLLEWEDPAEMPSTLYIEGYSPGSGSLVLTYEYEGKITCSDTVNMTAVLVNIADGEGSPIIDKQTNSVGQKISLKADIEPESALENLSYQWNIPGTIISNYVVYANQTSSQVFYVESSQLTNDFIDFYWVDGAENREVTLTVTSDNFALATTADFEVQAPTLVSLKSGTGQAGVYEIVGKWRLSSGRLFYNHEIELGIAWTGSVISATSFGGTFKYVHLINGKAVYTRHDNTTTNWVIGPGWWLDHFDPWDYRTWSINADESRDDLVDRDTPGFGLDSTKWKRITNEYQDFKLYLMFEPDVVGDAIYVPIGKLIWGWDGYAEYVQDQDEWTGEAVHKHVNPNGEPSVEFPVWIDKCSSDPEHPPVPTE